MKELKIKRIEVDENNRRAEHIKSFVAESEYRYSRRIEAVAERIEQEIDRKSVLLIAGPSGSGKTTTAHEVSARLALSGINAPVVSLDDFYKSFDQLPLPSSPAEKTPCNTLYKVAVNKISPKYTEVNVGETVYLFDFFYAL